MPQYRRYELFSRYHETIPGPWIHHGTPTYIALVNDLYELVSIETGQPTTSPLDSDDILIGLIPSSRPVAPSEYPAWADVDLAVDVGL